MGDPGIWGGPRGSGRPGSLGGTPEFGVDQGVWRGPHIWGGPRGSWGTSAFGGGPGCPGGTQEFGGDARCLGVPAPSHTSPHPWGPRQVGMWACGGDPGVLGGTPACRGVTQACPPPPQWAACASGATQPGTPYAEVALGEVVTDRFLCSGQESGGPPEAATCKGEWGRWGGAGGGGRGGPGTFPPRPRSASPRGVRGVAVPGEEAPLHSGEGGGAQPGGSPVPGPPKPDAGDPQARRPGPPVPGGLGPRLPHRWGW